MPEKPKISRVEVYWHTVRYRTVVLYTVVLSTIVLGAVYWSSRDSRQSHPPYFRYRHAARRRRRHRHRAAGALRQSRWQSAGEEGQFRAMGERRLPDHSGQGRSDSDRPEGVARIAFADGTTYTVKGDTLVTVEENNRRSGSAPRRSACTSVPDKWTWPPARGRFPVRRRKFPLKMPSLLCAQIAARPSAAIRRPSSSKSRSLPEARN